MTCVPREAMRFAEFMSYVKRGRGCWLWTGAAHPKGYGYFNLKGITPRAHRAAYYFAYGVDPGELFVCHRCDNPRCVRPSHLFLGTAADNVRDSVEKGRHTRGSVHGAAKLTEESARRAIEAACAGQTLTSIAEDLGVSRRTIRDVVSGKWWSHATKQEGEWTMPIVRDIRRIAKALQEMCAEHGWENNSFRCAELYHYHGAPRPTRIGQIMRMHHLDVAVEMGLIPSELEYEKGCFVVKAQPCTATHPAKMEEE